MRGSLPKLNVGIAAYSVMSVSLFYVGSLFAQTAPVSSVRPWHGSGEQSILADAKTFHEPAVNIDPAKTYTLPELIDLAESNNPETYVAWQRARSQAANLGIARSELYPALAAAALAEGSRDEAFFGTRFYRQTVGDFQVGLNLSYTIVDFGGRAGRISAAKAQLLAANFAFNDSHRSVIYQVEQAYYQLLNASGQEQAARASLANAQTVQQAAEDRLDHGLATLPDVLEARSSTAEAEYSLQNVIGQEQIAQGDLATALGTPATTVLHVQPLDQLTIPDSVDDSVEQAIDRALAQRPDLMQQLADLKSANARLKESRSAYYPTLSLNVNPAGQSLYGSQQTLPWSHTADLTGAASLTLTWDIFDGGARKNRVAQSQADVQAAEAQVKVVRDQVSDQVWAAYSNLNTAFRQRASAIALLEAANQSYDAALESYNYGLRSQLDVTLAQQTLAQARSTDVFARTRVLAALADLAFQTGDSIQTNAPKRQP